MRADSHEPYLSTTILNLNHITSFVCNISTQYSPILIFRPQIDRHDSGCKKSAPFSECLVHVCLMVNLIQLNYLYSVRSRGYTPSSAATAVFDLGGSDDATIVSSNCLTTRRWLSTRPPGPPLVFFSAVIARHIDRNTQSLTSAIRVSWAASVASARVSCPYSACSCVESHRWRDRS